MSCFGDWMDSPLTSSFPQVHPAFTDREPYSAPCSGLCPYEQPDTDCQIEVRSIGQFYDISFLVLIIKRLKRPWSSAR